MIYLVLILGFLLRLISINQSLWLDEATTALVAKMPIYDFFTKFMPGDFHPPFYYLVIRGWWLVVGGSEIALRIPSVLFGILTIYVVYLIAKELKQKWPIVPALFLATSGLHIYYSQEARMYVLATFLVTLAVYFYIVKKWKLFAIILPIIFLTDYLSLLIFPVLYLYKRSKKLLLASIPFFITFLAWLPYLSKQLVAGMSIEDSSWWNILGPVTLKNVALIPTKFMIGRVNIDNKFIYALVIVAISIIFTFIIGKAKNKLIWSWFGLSLVLGILISFFVPTLTYFRYLFILPAFYLLLSEKASPYFIVIILVINLVASGRYLFNSKFKREDWREVASAIGNQKVIFPVDSQKEALTYYGKEKNIISIDELLLGDKEVWLSRYVWDIFDPTDSTRIRLLNMGYNMISEENYNGVVIQKYESRN
jgi:hypothetical protein